MNRLSLALVLSLVAAPSALAGEDTFLQQLETEVDTTDLQFQQMRTQRQLDELQSQQERMRLQMEDLQYGAEAKAIGESNDRFYKLLETPSAPYFPVPAPK